MGKKEAHIVLVNGVYPPDGGASGLVANNFVRHLLDSGLEVTVITTQRNYKKTDEHIPPYGRVKRIKALNWKNSKLLRLLGALLDSYRLIKKARKVAPDYFIICTDPPFLHFISTFLLKDKKWVLWTMDLYPEAFVANNLVGKDNWFVKKFRNFLTKTPPTGIIALGQKQSSFLKNQYEFIPDLNVVVPCGVHAMPFEIPSAPKWKKDIQKVYFGYTGNIGEAHSAEFLIKMVRCSDPERHHFIFSLFGAKAKRIKNELKNEGHVEFMTWIPVEEMPFIDIQIVTLADEWTHICVPSKAVSAICMGVPIIYQGSSEGDIITQYPKAIWHLDSGRQTLEAFYSQLTTDAIFDKRRYTQNYAAEIHLDQKMGYSQIVKFLKNE